MRRVLAGGDVKTQLYHLTVELSTAEREWAHAESERLSQPLPLWLGRLVTLAHREHLRHLEQVNAGSGGVPTLADILADWNSKQEAACQE